MGRYEKGQTSDAVLQKKAAITQSIKNEYTVLLQATKTGELPKSLPLSNKRITLGIIQKWHDPDLQIISYSSNTGQTSENAELTAMLKNIIGKLNLLLKSDKLPKKNIPIKQKKSTNELNNEIARLKNEIEILKRTVTEVYRAYCMILAESMNTEDNNKKYVTSLRNQSEQMKGKFLKVIK
ncbi:hypothetical protein [uncultured Tolumonas sp.]|uniref:hypothetical protein n=1 Tax=uncultured Tolumonas sp. TaxID=263765 RepID=UPI002931B2E1|nr:hypothetical protein [uncultured Tolumonas sp.]